MAVLTSLPMLFAQEESGTLPIAPEETLGWRPHSRSRYLLRRGGTHTAPPVAATFAITDLGLPANSNGIRLKPVNRRHMDFHIFQQVAETVFPLLRLVEFKGRGDPLAHPNILEMLEMVTDYEPFFRLNTRGPHLSDAVIRQLGKMHGELVILLPGDEAFHPARGFESHLHGGLRLLRTLRDPARLAIRLAMPLTEQTASSALEVLCWTQQAGFDALDFHAPLPLVANQGAPISLNQLTVLRQNMMATDASLEIRVHDEKIKEGRALPAEPISYRNVPCGPAQPGGHAQMACMAPRQLVHIDLDGCVCGCDRLESRKLGNAVTVEAFADCWFGQEYKAFRDRMGRNQRAFYETCRSCIVQHSAA